MGRPAMTRTRALLLVSSIGIAAACSNVGSAVDPNATGGSQSHAGRSSRAGTGSSNGDAGDEGSGASGGGARPHAGNGSGGSAGFQGTGVLSLTKVEAHVVGRFGDAVRFTITGTQPDAGVYSIGVTFEDTSSVPVKVFDAAWDGSASSADGRIAF